MRKIYFSSEGICIFFKCSKMVEFIFRFLFCFIIEHVASDHELQIRGVTFLSGNACERLQVTGLDSFFYPDLRRFDFRGIFPPMCQIRFFIRISSRKNSLFYPFSVIAPKNLLRIQIRIKKQDFTWWNPDKKANLAHEWKNTPKIKSSQIRIKKRIQACDLKSFTSVSGQQRTEQIF